MVTTSGEKHESIKNIKTTPITLVKIHVRAHKTEHGKMVGDQFVEAGVDVRRNLHEKCMGRFMPMSIVTNNTSFVRTDV